MSKPSSKRGGKPGAGSARPVLFRALALLLPLLLLAAGEGACRLLGYGGYPPLLQKAGDDGAAAWFATNRRGTDTFFLNGGTQTGGMRELQFLSPKPPNTLRVVLAGESAIQGFPQILPLTDGAFLEAMLQDLRTDGRQVEVLNLGATAVASDPAVRILEAALRFEPDLVVVMAGSNEFYGASGVVSLPAYARSPLGIALLRAARSTALVQWLGTFRGAENVPSGTLMERMARSHEVAPDAPIRRAAARDLEAALTRAVRLCARRRVPVVVCTVPTNERGLAPIGAGGDAATHYANAVSLTREGRDPEALEEYVKARDRDTMPWRATSAARAAIVAAASRGAVLCDMEAAFRAESPGGAIGWELMDDHVHMTVRGQALFARTLAGSLAAVDGPLRVDPARLQSLPSWEGYAERLGRSAASDYFAVRNLRAIFDIPFMKRNNPEAHARFEERTRAILASLSPEDRAAVDRWQDPSLHGATDRPLEFVIGLNRLAEGNAAEAARLFRTARASVSPLSLWRLETTWHLLVAERKLHDQPTAGDLSLLREILHTGVLLARYGGADNPRVHRYLGLAYNLAGNPAGAIASLEKAMSEPGAADWDLVSALADSYLQANRAADARRLLTRAAGDSAMAMPAERMLRRIGG